MKWYYLVLNEAKFWKGENGFHNAYPVAGCVLRWRTHRRQHRAVGGLHHFIQPLYYSVRAFSADKWFRTCGDKLGLSNAKELLMKGMHAMWFARRSLRREHEISDVFWIMYMASSKRPARRFKAEKGSYPTTVLQSCSAPWHPAHVDFSHKLALLGLHLTWHGSFHQQMAISSLCTWHTRMHAQQASISFWAKRFGAAHERVKNDANRIVIHECHWFHRSRSFCFYISFFHTTIFYFFHARERPCWTLCTLCSKAKKKRTTTLCVKFLPLWFYHQPQG